MLSTRSGPDGVRSAAEVFDRWVAEEGKHFEHSEALSRLREAVEELRSLSRRLPDLGRMED